MAAWCPGAARSSIRLLRLQNVILPPLGTSTKARPCLEPALHTRIKFIHFGASARTAESPRTQDQSPGQLTLHQQSQHCESPRTQDQSPGQLTLHQQSQHCESPRTQDQSPGPLTLHQQSQHCGSPMTKEQNPALLPLLLRIQHCGTSDQIASPGTQDQNPALLPLLLRSQHFGTSDQIGSKKLEGGRRSWGALPYVVIGAGIGAVAAPVALTAVGFTGAGIAAGSVAASMMKASAIFYGGGVPAGGAVAVLQSLAFSFGVPTAALPTWCSSSNPHIEVLQWEVPILVPLLAVFQVTASAGKNLVVEKKHRRKSNLGIHIKIPYAASHFCISNE